MIPLAVQPLVPRELQMLMPDESQPGDLLPLMSAERQPPMPIE